MYNKVADNGFFLVEPTQARRPNLIKAMAAAYPKKEAMAALLYFYLALLTLLPFSSPFTPTDNYLLNCGSTANTTVDHRVFVGDSTRFLSGGQSVSLSATHPSPTSPALYNTAIVFKASSTYRFRIKKNGTHLVRLHFSPFQAQKIDLKSASFGVSVNGFSVLDDFSTNITVIKEFILSIDGDDVEIVFSLVKDSFFGFVNAIEVFSAPSELILDMGAKLVTASGTVEYNNLTSQVLETIHRINVGGSKLTPFNDTLWRTWIPDDDYLVLKSAAKRVSTFDPPNYQGGGATREVAPDSVYMTAQEMNSENSSISSKFNISWNFPVSSRVRHLVRLHFCDIVSKSLHELYFDVYINGYPAYINLDLSTLTFNLLASPYYIDFVVVSDSSGVISVSVGPSDLSSPMRINAVLNGAEIMKMVTAVDLPTVVKRKTIWIILGSVLGGFVLISILVLWILLCRRRRRKPKPRQPESVGWTPLRMYGGSSNSRTSAVTATTSPGTSNLKIPFSDLMSATNNFDKSLIVGSGGFGMVYKGVLRDNTKIAVKRGVPGSRQGLPEFQTEITVLSKIQHRHLVSLVGYCEEQSEMILVYEYMEKGSLKNHLYGSDLPPLTWKQRLEICIGAARGLHYLHTGSAQGIIHRDIKSTNILLDESYVAKVADFGLSRAGPCLDESHVSTAVKGSFGYLDPEYFRRQQLTDKSDVYSFGVVLFEVLCARPAVDPLLTREQVNLGEWAMMWHKKGLLEQIVDPCLAGEIKSRSLKKFGDTAEKCLAEYGVDRPSMGDVLWNLEHVLQLQENGQQIQKDGDVVEGQPSSSTNQRPGEDDDEEGDGGSELTGSQVFSQLINNEGR